MFRCLHIYTTMAAAALVVAAAIVVAAANVVAAAVVVAVKPPTEIVSIYYHMIPTNWLFTYHGCVLILIPLIF